MLVSTPLHYADCERAGQEENVVTLLFQARLFLFFAAILTCFPSVHQILYTR
jgi:hypothetical protein